MKELKKLRRSDLLEMLLSLSKENEQLRQQLHQAEEQLKNHRFTEDFSESLAKAHLRLQEMIQMMQSVNDQHTADSGHKEQQKPTDVPGETVTPAPSEELADIERWLNERFGNTNQDE